MPKFGPWSLMEVTKGRLLPAPEWNPEEAALVARRVVRKVLTDEIYSQYVRISICLNRGRMESFGNAWWRFYCLRPQIRDGWDDVKPGAYDGLGRFCDIYCTLMHFFCVTCYLGDIWKLWTKKTWHSLSADEVIFQYKVRITVHI